MLARRRAAPLFALILSFLFAAGASAHANLERSTPSANQLVVERPRQVQLWFSEQPEVRLTQLQLLDPTGKLVANLAPRAALSDPTEVLAPLPELQPGTYLVTWRTTSAVDGHTTAGSFPFTYGVGQQPVAVSVPGLSAETGAGPSSTLAVAARFLTFTGAVGLAGGLGFGPLVLWPAVAALPGRRRQRDEAELSLERAGRRALALVGAYAVPALLLGTVLAAVSQAAESADLPPLAVFGAPLERVLVGTRYGTLFGARAALVVAAGVVLALLVRWSRGRAALYGVGLLATGGVLATLSLGAHAAAAPSLTALVVGLDFLHAAAASIWVGGLAQLCLVAALLGRGRDDRREALSGLIGQFSLMTVVVATIAVTGVVQALVEVGPSLTALTQTPYGQALMAKVVLFLAMAGLGFWHWRAVGPRLEAAAAGAGRGTAAALDMLRARFRLSAFAEAGLGVLVLLATGVMTAEQPAKDAAVTLRHVSATAKADDLTFDLTVRPGEAGVNRIELRVSPPPRNVEKVALRLRHLGMDMGEQEVELKSAGSDLYTLDDGSFSMSGQWQVEPIVRRAGRDDARAPVTIGINDPLTAQNQEPPPPLELTPRMILGLEGVIFGAVLVVGSRVLRRRNARAALGAVVGGVAAIGLGVAVTAMAVQTEAASPDRLRNPIAMDADAYARARVLYQQNCFQCHGIAGRGDGPVGRALNPRPADLKLHVTQHSEGQLYDYVSNGFPGSAMPAFKDTLSSDDRWRLIGFIKGFADDGPPAAQTATAELRVRPASGSSSSPTVSATPGVGATPTPNGTPEAVGPVGPPSAARSADDPQRALARPLAADPGTTAAAADLGGRTATVRIQPARYQLGQPNAVQIEVAGAPPTAVTYSFTMASHQMPPDAGQANPLGNGRYEIPAAPRFDMAGDWRLDLDVDGRVATYWLTVSPSDGAIQFVDA